MSLHEVFALLPYIILSVGGLLVLMLEVMQGQGKSPVWLSATLIILVSYFVCRHAQLNLDVENFLKINAFSQLSFLFFAFVALLVVVSSSSDTVLKGKLQASYYALILFALLGMGLVSAAINLVALIIGIELIGICGFCLVAWSPKRPGAVEAATKYLITATVAGAFLMLGVALVYLGSGSLNIYEISASFSNPHAIPLLVQLGLSCLLVGLGFELALIPFHSWLADVYQGAPLQVVALLGIVGKLSVVSFLIVLYRALGSYWHLLEPVLLVISLLTIVGGNLLALKEQNLRRLLAYSSVSQFGLLVLPLAIISQNWAQDFVNLSMVLYYAIAYGIATLAILFAIDKMENKTQIAGNLISYQSFGRYYPLVSLGLLAGILSLAGIPPFSGFFAKLLVFFVLFKKSVFIAIIVALTTVLSLYYYMRISVNLYSSQKLGTAPKSVTVVGSRCSLWGSVPLLFYGFLLLALGIFAQPVLAFLVKIVMEN